MERKRANRRRASASPRSRRIARYSSTRFHRLVRNSAERYRRYFSFPRTSSMRAYVSRKNRGALPASSEFVLEPLRIHDPVLQRTESSFDTGLVDFEDDFIARLESKLLSDIARDDDSERRAPAAYSRSGAWHGYHMLYRTYNSSPRFGETDSSLQCQIASIAVAEFSWSAGLSGWTPWGPRASSPSARSTKVIMGPDLCESSR